MATHVHTPGASSRAPSFNRRAMLGAVITAGAVAAAVPALAQPTSATADGITPAFAALLAESDRASDAAARFSREVYKPLYDRCEGQCAAVPHIQVLARYQAVGGTAERMLSTADDVAVRSALIAAERDPSFMCAGNADARGYRRSLRRLATAHKWRERKLARIRKASDFRAAYEQSEAYDEACFAAHDAVATYPVATLPDLLALGRYLERQGEENSAALTAGIRRLAGEKVA